MPLPVTPVREWDTVPVRSLSPMDEVAQITNEITTAMFISPLSPNDNKRSRLALDQPTYLPYTHSRDLLKSVNTLQQTCEDLNYHFEENTNTIQHILTEEVTSMREGGEADRQWITQILRELIHQTEITYAENERRNALLEEQNVILERQTEAVVKGTERRNQLLEHQNALLERLIHIENEKATQWDKADRLRKKTQ
jgi:hypothetical protein